MAGSKLKIDIRRSQILEQLRIDGKVSVSRLSESLGATPVTIRNDLATLERDGYLIRVQGGAVLAQRPVNNPVSGVREDVDFHQKQVIAAAVADMIQDGDTLFFNSGTTTLHIAKALQSRKHLHIVTNSVEIATALGNNSNFKVLLLGGEINTQYGFTYGGDTQDQLYKYRADWAILSVDGVSAKGGITTYHAEEAIIDRLMMANAKQHLVAATGKKIGKAGFSRICDSNGEILLVTDNTCQKEAIALLREQNVRVVQA